VRRSHIFLSLLIENFFNAFVFPKSSCPNRPATCDWNTYNSPSPNAQTLWGALIGGPDASDNYVDARSNYQQNEPACDYNAGFQSAVAGLLKLAVQGIVP
jgi:endoglucanase